MPDPPSEPDRAQPPHPEKQTPMTDPLAVLTALSPLDGRYAAKVEPLPASQNGVYRFKAHLTMAGQWALKLMAKVPGEAETLEGSVVFRAQD